MKSPLVGIMNVLIYTHQLDKQESFKIVDSLVVLEVFSDFIGGVFLSIGLWTSSQILAQRFWVVILGLMPISSENSVSLY